MVEINKYINDYRNLVPYYNLVFRLMEEVAQYSFERDVLKITRAIRELIINTAPYQKNPKKKLETIEKELEKVLTKEFFIPNKSREQIEKAEKNIDNYIKFINLLRVELHEELTKSGLMPKSFIDEGKPAIVKYNNGGK